MSMKNLGNKVRSNLYKSKKMRVVGLGNDLPWLYSVFQGEEV